MTKNGFGWGKTTCSIEDFFYFGNLTISLIRCYIKAKLFDKSRLLFLITLNKI